MNAAQVAQLKVGTKVLYKTGGKVARLEGVAGKMMPATVTRTTIDDGRIGVMPEHRKPKSAQFHGMGSSVEVATLQLHPDEMSSARAVQAVVDFQGDSIWIESVEQLTLGYMVIARNAVRGERPGQIEHKIFVKSAEDFEKTLADKWMRRIHGTQRANNRAQTTGFNL